MRATAASLVLVDPPGDDDTAHSVVENNDLPRRVRPAVEHGSGAGDGGRWWSGAAIIVLRAVSRTFQCGNRRGGYYIYMWL
jgi:hypothetical protein